MISEFTKYSVCPENPAVDTNSDKIKFNDSFSQSYEMKPWARFEDRETNHN
jgi:hypothetical protein